MKRIVFNYGLVCIVAILAGSVPIAPAFAADSQRIVDAETFQRSVVGRRLTNTSLDVEVVIQSNGTLSGTLHNDRLTGYWQFQNGYFCRSYRTRSEVGATDCQIISFDDLGITLIYHQGNGRHERYQFAN